MKNLLLSVFMAATFCNPSAFAVGFGDLPRNMCQEIFYFLKGTELLKVSSVSKRLRKNVRYFFSEERLEALSSEEQRDFVKKYNISFGLSSGNMAVYSFCFPCLKKDLSIAALWSSSKPLPGKEDFSIREIFIQQGLAPIHKNTVNPNNAGILHFFLLKPCNQSSDVNIGTIRKNPFTNKGLLSIESKTEEWFDGPALQSPDFTMLHPKIKKMLKMHEDMVLSADPEEIYHNSLLVMLALKGFRIPRDTDSSEVMRIAKEVGVSSGDKEILGTIRGMEIWKSKRNIRRKKEED